MSADWTTPGLSDAYSDVLSFIDERLDDVLVGFDPAVVTPSNFPTNAIRWTSASNKWQKWDGATWNDLASTYAIAISGNAGTATKWATARTLAISGDGSGTSSSWDGSGNATLTLTLGTVSVGKGGTNITSYAIGDILYASGTGTLSKLADVATGNALISGGVGAAPAYGKIGLTTHISGTLAVTNGGTGRATGTTAYGLIAAGTTATGTQQTLPAGLTTEILVGGGASALPAWTTATGSGAPVRATSPTLVTPVLGTPTSGTLSNCTVDGTDSVGFRNIPQNSQSTNYTLVAADSGKHIYHPAADTNDRTYTIPANASVAFAIGTAVTFVNLSANNVTIAITTDTMYLAGTGSTGSRTLAQYGTATAMKTGTTEWVISGSGIT